MRNKLNEEVIAANNRQQREDNMNPKTGLKTRCRKINGPVAAPLLYVKRDKQGPQGQPKGQFTTGPTEIDGVVRALEKIYDGNCHNVSQTIERFMQTYDKYICKKDECSIREIDTELVQEAFSKGGK